MNDLQKIPTLEQITVFPVKMVCGELEEPNFFDINLEEKEDNVDNK